tara:strand:- start:2093 stop:2251 length:159 start_codon:yes stop_codon:yes gene_type:complete
MTGISGIEFVSWALPITVLVLVVGVLVINHFGPRIEKWGEKHIKRQSNNRIK